MNILVTGGAGYIGIELVYALANLNSAKKIMIYDAMLRSHFNVFGGSRRIPNGIVEFLDANLLDNSSLQKAVDSADVIFHLAAEVPNQFTSQNAHIFDQINNWGSGILVSCIEKSESPKKIIYLSSLQVFGNGEIDLQKDRPAPNTFYGFSKLRGEGHFNRLVEENFHSVSIIRCSTVYGYSKNLRLGTGINRLVFDANFKSKVSIHGVSEYQAPHIYLNDLIAFLIRSIGDSKNGISYTPMQNVRLDKLILALNEVFQNLDIIYLEQDHPITYQRISSIPSLSESSELNTSNLSKNIKMFSESFTF